LVIDPPVYIPRVETEQYVLVLAQRILSFDPSPQNAIRVLDICSGSGCIPLLLAKEGGGRIKTVGLEVDDRALSVARKNAERNGVAHLSTFEKFDLFEDDVEALRDRLGTFDVVISNPPYVSSEDMRKVASTWWEGRYALQGKLRGSSNGGGEGEGGDGLGDDDGLSFYRRIREVYALFLSRSRPRSLPKLVLEVGATQSPPVKEMYAAEGRLEVQKETPRRKELGAPQLEQGDVVGTERSVWIYESEP
jgi:methylase of polypeptide subunit release factors